MWLQVTCSSLLSHPPRAATSPAFWLPLAHGNEISYPLGFPSVQWADTPCHKCISKQIQRPRLHLVLGTAPFHIFNVLPYKVQRRNPNICTIWSTGEGDEIALGPSLSFRNSPATSRSQRPARHRAWVMIKGYLFPRAPFSSRIPLR